MIPFVHTSFRHRPAADLPPLTTARAGALFLDERGAATAEYAIATMATIAWKRHTTGRCVSLGASRQAHCNSTRV